MRFHLEMNCDSDAFDPTLKGADTVEVARILREIAGKLASDGQRVGRCWDANGKPVGNWSFDLDGHEKTNRRVRA